MIENAIFLSEHLIMDGHTGEILEGLKNQINNLILIDYKKTYFNFGKKKFEEQIEEIIIKNDIQLIVLNLGDARVIDPEFIIKISNKLRVKICIIFPDSEHMFEEADRYYAQCADVCWIFNPFMRANFENYGYDVYDSFGLSLKLRKKIEIEKKYLISFIGAVDRGDRKNYIQFLSSKFNNFYIAGYASTNGKLSNEERDIKIQSSLIQLNFSKVQNPNLNIYSRVRQFKSRIYESFLLDTFILTEYYAGIEQQLGEKWESICFRDEFELVEKINYFTENLEELRFLVRHFKKIVLENYGTNKVAKNLLRKIEKTKIKNKIFIWDKNFKSRYLSQRFYFLSKFMINLKFQSAFNELCYIQKNIKHIKFNFIYYELPRGIYHAIKQIN